MPEAFLTRWASPQSAVKTVSQPHRQRFCLDRSDLQQVHNFASHISSFQPQNPGTQLMQLATSSRNVVSSTHAEPCLMQRVRVNTDARRKQLTSAPESTSMSTTSPAHTLGGVLAADLPCRRVIVDRKNLLLRTLGGQMCRFSPQFLTRFDCTCTFASLALLAASFRLGLLVWARRSTRVRKVT